MFLILLSIFYFIYASRYGPRAKLLKRVESITGSDLKPDRKRKQAVPKRKQIRDKLKSIDYFFVFLIVVFSLELILI